jgi:CubicO group peptidase (beta-lactamase class C family)
MKISHSNWLTAPYNREAFWRVSDITSVVPFHNTSGNVFNFVERLAALDDIRVPTVDGMGLETLEDHFVNTFCDAICVVRDGVVRYEWRAGDSGGDVRAPQDPAARHLLMSVSKSICATVLGAAISRGDVALSDEVDAIAPEFADTSVAGATLRHLVDMTAGTEFVEDYDFYEDPDSEAPVVEYDRQANYRPLARKPGIGVLATFREYPKIRAHGACFDYRSPLTNVLARALEVATGKTFLDVWSVIGAEHPADMIVDHVGFPSADGGISCSLRDLARWGQIFVADGKAYNDVQVVSSSWVTESTTPDDEALKAFANDPNYSKNSHDRWSPIAYRNAWWIFEPGKVLTGAGIFGQFCWVHRPSRTVIVRFSTTPLAWMEPIERACYRAFEVIVQSLD